MPSPQSPKNVDAISISPLTHPLFWIQPILTTLLIALVVWQFVYFQSKISDILTIATRTETSDQQTASINNTTTVTIVKGWHKTIEMLDESQRELAELRKHLQNLQSDKTPQPEASISSEDGPRSKNKETL